MCNVYLCNIRPWCAHVRDTWQQTCLKRNSNVQCAMGHLDNKWEMRLDETWVDISTWDNLLPLSLEAEKHSGWWGLSLGHPRSFSHFWKALLWLPIMISLLVNSFCENIGWFWMLESILSLAGGIYTTF